MECLLQYLDDIDDLVGAIGLLIEPIRRVLLAFAATVSRHYFRSRWRAAGQRSPAGRAGNLPAATAGAAVRRQQQRAASRRHTHRLKKTVQPGCRACNHQNSPYRTSFVVEIFGVADRKERETLGFQTEVRQLLQLMIHSLYSNKEIFLRELISNASDAADKLRFAALASPELLAEDTNLAIRIELDKDKRQLSVIDNGIGMSRDELIDNLGTIARSGTAEFLERMTGDQKHDAKLIGQFGVGFYSSFIVAEKVTVESRRAGLPATEAVRWESEGEGEFSVESIERAERGTRVTLHLKDEQVEFTEPLRVETLIRKYSDHIGFPVTLTARGDKDNEDKLVNSATALWTRPRKDVTDDEYKEFYKYLTHDFADPLTWSHNRVEGKSEYTSLLYIPAAAPFDLWNRDAPRGLKLYVQRVFIMDEAEQFLPLYLRFVKGIVDSADLPLNVSRELLQQNPKLVAMRGALTKRVLAMLEKMATDSPDDYKTLWREFGQVLKEGVVEDHANKDRLAKLLRFASTHGGNDLQETVAARVPGTSRIGSGQDLLSAG